ncbi:MAG: hypothetical protein KFF72_20265, partial [Arthrospira sp. SH-MAG29]|nr:hypothetical protein [Arthrospira sp. SH-MAG29]
FVLSTCWVALALHPTYFTQPTGLLLGCADASPNLLCYFSRKCDRQYHGQISASKQHKKEKAIWQRRFWEHCIVDETDFINHVEYIHYNPVKHGLVKAPKDWQYSSFLKYVRQGIYDINWGAETEIVFDENVGRE